MRDLVIFDGNGYFVRRRRSGESVVDIWSPHKKDAARFTFAEVAKKFASTIPQPVEIRPAN